MLLNDVLPLAGRDCGVVLIFERDVDEDEWVK